MADWQKFLLFQTWKFSIASPYGKYIKDATFKQTKSIFGKYFMQIYCYVNLCFESMNGYKTLKYCLIYKFFLKFSLLWHFFCIFFVFILCPATDTQYRLSRKSYKFFYSDVNSVNILHFQVTFYRKVYLKFKFQIFPFLQLLIG